MAFRLGDIFIGSFHQTQGFGERPTIYAARYNLQGHNGVDFGCPSLTPILSTADGVVSETGFDAAGYGNYVKIVHQGYLTLYAHLNDITVKKGDHVISGQLIAHSNNTGFSDAPHLHFGVAPCDPSGIKAHPDNGYAGYINPMGTECIWEIKNLQAPALQDTTVQPPIAVPSEDFVRMVGEGTNYKVIRSYALEHGINDYLSQTTFGVLDPAQNAKDPEGGAKVVAYLMYLRSEIDQLRRELAVTPPLPPTILDLPVDKRDSFLSPLFTKLRDFIFTNK